MRSPIRSRSAAAKSSSRRAWGSRCIPKTATPRHAAAQRRSRDVRREGRRSQHLSLSSTSRCTTARCAALTIERRLRSAIQRGEFELLYQPLVATASRQPRRRRGVAALGKPRPRAASSRINSSAVAEHTRADRRHRRLGTADRMRAIARAGASGADALRIAVNVSPRQFRGERLLAKCAKPLPRTSAGELPADRGDRRTGDPQSAGSGRDLMRSTSWASVWRWTISARAILAVLPEALSVRRAEDRPRLRARSRLRSGRPRACHRGDPHGQGARLASSPKA